MKTQIVKVIFEDQTSIEMHEYKALISIENEPREQRIERLIQYRRKIRNFENMILKNINEDDFKSYAENEYDLVEKDDCWDEPEPEKNEIGDFTDQHLLDELKSRTLFGDIQYNIITTDFLTRFSKIVAVENQLLIDNLLSEIESKLGI